MQVEFNYRKLVVWQKAMQMVGLVYAELKKLPLEEKYALTDQIRRAAISVVSNIAEGAGRSTNKDYSHFLAIARGSLYELMSELEIAEQLGYIIVSTEIESLAAEIARMLGSMLKKYGSI
ncbi:MAG: four helix bundle protein [Kiritimatiellae bacterium]|jgi:four helix bundle protein|nr:four helix bundle protein [Kiritimatiellia bacterium]